MGGTRADASLVTGGTAVHDAGGAVAEIPLALPSILIETVSAGGGSIARVDEGGALKVGPESAGAVPGPACYGRGGGRPTGPDARLLLGWLDAGGPPADGVRLGPALAERAGAAPRSAPGGGGGRPPAAAVRGGGAGARGGLSLRGAGIRGDDPRSGRRPRAPGRGVPRDPPGALRPRGRRPTDRARQSPRRGGEERGRAPPPVGRPGARAAGAAGAAHGNGGRRAGRGERVAAGRARRGRRARGPGDPRGRRRHGAGRAGVARPGRSLGRGPAAAAMTLDAVGLEVMGHAFAAIAEETGLVLIHSALSPNIRERRDCSAALFDPDGEMIAQAAHIPVHLGALAESVATGRALAPRPGDVFLLNHPYTGGSHLPDLTVIGAIELEGGVGGYSAVRAHHSDVGGAQAGSMPAGAREIFAEGIVLPPVRWTPEVERLLLANVRTPDGRPR